MKEEKSRSHYLLKNRTRNGTNLKYFQMMIRRNGWCFLAKTYQRGFYISQFWKRLLKIIIWEFLCKSNHGVSGKYQRMDSFLWFSLICESSNSLRWWSMFRSQVLLILIVTVVVDNFGPFPTICFVILCNLVFSRCFSSSACS